MAGRHDWRTSQDRPTSPKLFKAWGIQYDPQQDRARSPERAAVSGRLAREGQAPGTPSAILGFSTDDLNHDEVTVTATLDTINVSTAGAFELAPS